MASHRDRSAADGFASVATGAAPDFFSTNKLDTIIPNYDTLLEMVKPSYDSFSNNNAPLGEVLTSTIEKKMETEVDIQEIYDNILDNGSDNFPSLERRQHLMYTHGFLSSPLPGLFAKLDASQSWICYWLMNSVVLLNHKLTEQEADNASKKLLFFYNQINANEGGFGGGYSEVLGKQEPHLAASYAALMALALTGNKEAWSKIDRLSVKKWLLSVKQPNGSFVMLNGAECDVRAVYCALCIASILDILDDNLKSGVKEWIIKTQTYEGGFSGDIGDEAHGGYTFCALASLFILMTPTEILESDLDLDTLIKWATDRQYSLEGGFSGRTNKLVDGCYSHWVGGTIALLEILVNFSNSPTDKFLPLIDRQRLQNYILCCCQDRFGLRDKPGCKADFYHTNYVLCGLSMCQHFQFYDSKLGTNPFAFYPQRIERNDVVDNLEINEVHALDPIFGLPHTYAKSMFDFFNTN